MLAETPPAPDLPGLHALWADVGPTVLVQVAEQYPLMPLHAARLAIVQSGAHRHTNLGAGQLDSPLSRRCPDAAVPSGPPRAGDRHRPDVLGRPRGSDHSGRMDTHRPSVKQAETTLACIDFGSGRMGRYDFTDNQWWNPVRPDHLMVRGSAGEIFDDTVVRMADNVTPVTSRIERSMTGMGMNYEGLDLTHLSLDGRVVFRNAVRRCASVRRRHRGGRPARSDGGVDQR